MSTNYYAKSDFPIPVKLHIGRASYGWAFALHVYPALGIHHKSDWKEILERSGVVVLDEYDREVGADVFWYVVEAADPARGLLRHRQAIGDGVVDLCDWEFS